MIIKNQDIMTKFIKLLIYELRTIDGNRDTALPLIKKGVRKMMTQYGYVDELK